MKGRPQSVRGRQRSMYLNDEEYALVKEFIAKRRRKRNPSEPSLEERIRKIEERLDKQDLTL